MKITVQTTIASSLARVWECWTLPEHIVHWNFASPEWCCPTATNDLTPGGDLNWRMEARDGSMGFDFTGTYEEIKPLELITYHIVDGRKVSIAFSETEHGILVSETFEAENTHTEEQQRAGWQMILNNFKAYVESGE